MYAGSECFNNHMNKCSNNWKLRGMTNFLLKMSMLNCVKVLDELLLALKFKMLNLYSYSYNEHIAILLFFFFLSLSLIQHRNLCERRLGSYVKKQQQKKPFESKVKILTSKLVYLWDWSQNLDKVRDSENRVKSEIKFRILRI